MIQLTPDAIEAVKSAMSRSTAPAAGLRIMVETGGCAGFKYMMGIEKAPRDGDEVIEQDGVVVFIDDLSAPHLAGMKVDFVAGLESSGFVFDNPNAASKCACGKSFG